MKKTESISQPIPKFKKELAQELGYSLSTFQRKLKAQNIEIPRGLISPNLQVIILNNLNRESDDTK